MQKGYNVLIGWAMQHKKQLLVGHGARLCGRAWTFVNVPQHLFPTAEREQFVIDVWLPEGTRIETTDATTRRIEAVLSHESLVKEYASYLGSSSRASTTTSTPKYPLQTTLRSW